MKKMILVAISFQILVLISFIFFAYAPLYFGSEVKLRAVGYDPRDIFLGNYVRLRYPDMADIKINEKVHKNQKIYVVLQKDEDLYKAKFATTKKPESGVYLSGRVSYDLDIYSLDFKFGVEKYYLPMQKALKMEDELRQKEAIVTLGVLKGFARIKKVEIKN